MNNPLAGVLGFVLGAMFLLPIGSIFDPVPYSDVELRRQEVVGDRLELDYFFEKTDCVFVSLDIYGSVGDFTSLLSWTNTDGFEGDRPQGPQDLHLVVNTQGRVLEALTIVTRHSCDGEVVNRVFDRVEL